MVSGSSSRDTDFTTSAENAISTALPSARRAGTVNMSAPGLRMIKVPIKPTTMADQRLGPTRSLRNSAAPAVANKGTVKPIAMTWAKGIKVRTRNHDAKATTTAAARAMCKRRCRVRRRTPRSNHGSRNNRPNAVRKKVTSMGWSSPPTWRPMAPMAVKKMLAEIIHSPPCTAAGMEDGEGEGAAACGMPGTLADCSPSRNGFGAPCAEPPSRWRRK